MRRFIIAAALAAATLTSGLAVPATSHAAGPGYLTIQFGRSIEGSYSGGRGCTIVPGIETLAQVETDMASRGMTAIGTVVVDRTSTTTTEDCEGGDVYADWSDLQGLQAQGWSFVSDGETHNNMTTMTPAGQQQESCGSLSSFSTYLPGDTADGLFAYGDNHSTPTIQKNIVAPCFYYGRKYWNGGVNVRTAMLPNGYQKTQSITGGACNTVGLTCNTPKGGQNGKHYMSPATLAAAVAGEQGDQWIDLQFYRLVTGKSTQSAAFSWDCTGATWQLHWTSQTEMYCANDFDAILSVVPPTTTVTDPATVAVAWSRPV